MKKETTPITVSGSSFSALLTILFIGLKLTGYIEWAWVWVLAPSWITALITIAALAVLIVAKTKSN